MKRLVTTAGFLALGAASTQAIYAPELTRLETGKPWTVAASLRGFYDSNWATQPDYIPGQKDSWGFEARPYVGLNFPMEQTLVGISYLNSSRFYEARSNGDQDAWDFQHQFDLKFDHQFSPRYRLKVNDSFLYSSYPDVLQGGVVTMPFRSDLTYYRNLAAVTLSGEFTRQMGFSLSYLNTFYDYTDKGPDSYSARLDRLEHRIPVDLRWQVQPDLVGLIGYQFSLFDYTGGEAISDGLPSSSRNNQNHALYVGGDYDITAQWRTSLRVGGQYTTYESYSSQDSWAPYLDFALSYFYTVGSHADVGVKHIMAATDVSTAADGMPTLSQEVTAAYLFVSHAFTPKLSGNLLLQYQWGTFQGGLFDEEGEGLMLFSLYGSYRLNQFLSLEAGYNYSWLDSEIQSDGIQLRDYDRSFVYLGVRAHY
jgi:hypothetical protein